MPAVRITSPSDPQHDRPALAGAVDLDAIRAELEIPGAFPQAALDQAAALAERWRDGADAGQPPVTDATAVPFVTLDPPGSTDLDQAVELSALEDGFRVRYAIADVSAAVPPGSPVDDEAFRRGQTFYSPDRRDPLYPPAISEGCASLLPGVRRRAVLWTIELAADGSSRHVAVERALVRSTAQLDYPSVQRAVDGDGQLHPSLALLPTIGALRLALARGRGAISLDLPDAEVERDAAGRWTLQLRAQLPVERWNAEISLLTGMSAAQLVLDAGAGLLRTLPAPDERAVRQLRATARALDIDWPDGAAPGEVIAGVDSADPAGAAFLQDAVRLLRGAGYLAFAGGAPTAEAAFHGGVGAPYAHVTAPLRRLGDRLATEYALAAAAGTPVPAWVTDRVDDAVATMTRSDRQAHALERRCVAAVAGVLLADRVGEVLDGVVVQIEGDRATVALREPPVEARTAAAGLVEGQRVRVRLTAVTDGAVTVEPVG